MKLKDSIVITDIDDYYVLVDWSAGDDRLNGLIKPNVTSSRE